MWYNKKPFRKILNFNWIGNNLKKDIIGIIGLGYVGLPLALAFSRKKHVIGFDKDKERINQLKRGIDRNNEFKKELKAS